MYSHAFHWEEYMNSYTFVKGLYRQSCTEQHAPKMNDKFSLKVKPKQTFFPTLIELEQGWSW